MRHIRFPFYRNLRTKLRIEFLHPITALVGPNGTNKTAILRALQGCPDYNNVGNYWYSTTLDPIIDGDRHRFIHGYIAPSTGQIVESVQTQIKKAYPDYFEPSRPLLTDDMERMPKVTDDDELPPERAKTRWRGIDKQVIYVDFRSELSAYDKYFFHSPTEREREQTLLRRKKNVVRRNSPHLAESIRTERESHDYYRRERIVVVASAATGEQLMAISAILGRKYSEIRYITHRYYGIEGTTVLLKSFDHRYSEAFAGSGEFAVAVMVRKVMSATNYSLILLDEPEVSLHPKAQQRLMDFLGQECKKKKHQIVISTHSPEIIRELPAHAIKLLQQNEVDGKIDLVSQSTEPAEAFFRIGVRLDKVKTIYVEDLLAAAIVERALEPFGMAINTTVDIEPLPGGAEAISTNFVPSFALSSNSNAFVLLDGDQSTPDRPSTPATVSDADLEAVLKTLLHGEPALSLDGSNGVSSPGQKTVQRRKILDWTHNHLDYLPGGTPEALLMEMAEIDGDKSEAKEYWCKLTTDVLSPPEWDRVSASDILAEQKRALARVELDHPVFKTIRERVKPFLDGLETSE
ncbi:AAA family ATPase [Kribbella endophytica]